MAKRPPSSCTIGRRSGGMTGSTFRIIHSGRLPDLRKASTTRRRLAAFLRRCLERVCANLEPQLLGHALQVDLGDDVIDGLGAHAGLEDVAPACPSARSSAVSVSSCCSSMRLQLVDLVVDLSPGAWPLLALQLSAEQVDILLDQRTALSRSRTRPRSACVIASGCSAWISFRRSCTSSVQASGCARWRSSRLLRRGRLRRPRMQMIVRGPPCAHLASSIS